MYCLQFNTETSIKTKTYNNQNITRKQLARPLIKKSLHCSSLVSCEICLITLSTATHDDHLGYWPVGLTLLENSSKFE